MAKTKIGGITVEIGADTSDLSKKLKDVNTESKKPLSDLFSPFLISTPYLSRRCGITSPCS